MNVSRLELEVGIKHGRNDGVSVWIFCVGASVRLDGCSGVGFGFWERFLFSALLVVYVEALLAWFACYMFRSSSNNVAIFFSHGPTAANGPESPHYRGFMITFSHATLRRAPLEKWSTGRRDLYLTRHNIHKRQTSMPSVGFEPAIPSKRAATGNGPPIMHFNTWK